MFKQIRKAISMIIVVAFISTSIESPTYAQAISNGNMPWMPKPGIMVHLSSAFRPSTLTGISIHSDNALQFDFLVNKGEQVIANPNDEIEEGTVIK